MTKYQPLLLVYPDSTPAARVAAKQFADNIVRRTDGLITIAPLPISKLVNQPALVSMVLDEKADMALPAHDRLSQCSPFFGCVGTPFAFDDYEHVDRVLDGEFADQVQLDLDKVGVTYLSCWEWGFRQITNSRRPILKPEDMQGLKIRVPTTPLCQDSMLALGATPAMVEFEQLIRAIRQGLIDGQENPLAVIHALGLQHAQKYLSLLNYTYGTLVHIVKTSSLKSLAPEHREIIREESQNAARLMRQQVRLHETEQLAEFVAQGMAIDRPDPAPFKALMEPVHRMICQSFGTETEHAFLGMVERQRRPITRKAE
jgi:TRAP-type transport system periplasmic protein